MSMPSQHVPLPHGFTLVVRELATQAEKDAHPDKVWVELRFNRPPTPEWKRTARGVLNRMSCGKLVEIHGECKSHSPQYTDMIMQDALVACGQLHTAACDSSEV